MQEDLIDMDYVDEGITHRSKVVLDLRSLAGFFLGINIDHKKPANKSKC